MMSPMREKWEGQEDCDLLFLFLFELIDVLLSDGAALR